jgi:hydrogenase/urease accessory protein HupE
MTAVRMLLLAIVLAGSRAWAHPLSPALLDLRESADGLVHVTWKMSAIRAPGTDLRPELPAHCRAVSAGTAIEAGDSITAEWTVDCRPQGLVGQRLGVDGLAGARTDALIRLALADGRVVQAVARASEPLVVMQAPARPATVVTGYLKLGFEHILSGPDHLLFVLGLLLVAGGVRRVLGTITAFTVGHSITLTLAALGISTVPSAPVELAIALTIYVLALELARGTQRGPTLLGRFPWAMAFAFGLLHGFGFAGALREAGLPAGDVPRALFSFNVGIELGQLAFVLCMVAVGRALQGLRPRLPAWSVRVPAYAIGSVAVFWCCERAATMWLR